MNSGEIALTLMVLMIILLVIILVLIVRQKGALVRSMSGELGGQLEQKHRAMIGDVGGMFNQVSERVGRELTLANSGTREVIGTLQVQVVHSLSQQTQASLKQLALLQQTSVRNCYSAICFPQAPYPKTCARGSPALQPGRAHSA